MNNFQTDDMLNLAKEKNQEDVESQLFLKATQVNGIRWLAALGAWMIAKGEKMQARYTAPLRSNPLAFPSKAKKARAH
jgi:hypothetical protein